MTRRVQANSGKAQGKPRQRSTEGGEIACRPLPRRQRSAAKPSDVPGLNRRGSEFLGRTFVLHEAIVGGRGKIRAGDTLWLVTGPDLQAGSEVRVTGQDGVLLKVEPA